MNRQNDLDFDAAREIPPSVKGAPSTSAAAAASVVGSAEAQRRRVYEALKARGTYGATNEELQYELGLTGDSIRPRVWKLRGCNRKRADLPTLVVDSGLRRTTARKRRAVVWVIAGTRT